jgi:hypothetical protein
MQGYKPVSPAGSMGDYKANSLLTKPTNFDSCRVARSAAKVTTVDPSVREPSPCLRHCSCAGEMTSQGDLVLQQGHENATGCCVMYFVITVGLLVLIDDEGLHLCGLASMWEMGHTQ